MQRSVWPRALLEGAVVCLLVLGCRLVVCDGRFPAGSGPGTVYRPSEASEEAVVYEGGASGLFGAQPAYAQGYESYWDALYLLAHVIEGEAADEPFIGKVAVGAVILNRVRDPRFPKTVAGVIFQPWAFESVSNGEMWRPLSNESIRAAQAALAGWDPTYGALFFWNPAKVVSPWIWTRTIITWIGRHVFAR